jgi:hypothetical protein
MRRLIRFATIVGISLALARTGTAAVSSNNAIREPITSVRTEVDRLADRCGRLSGSADHGSIEHETSATELANLSRKGGGGVSFFVSGECPRHEAHPPREHVNLFYGRQVGFQRTNQKFVHLWPSNPTNKMNAISKKDDSCLQIPHALVYPIVLRWRFMALLDPKTITEDFASGLHDRTSQRG